LSGFRGTRLTVQQMTKTNDVVRPWGKESFGREAKRQLDAAEERAVAAEAEVAQLRVNVSDIEASAAYREDALRNEARAAGSYTPPLFSS